MSITLPDPAAHLLDLLTPPIGPAPPESTIEEVATDQRATP